jgi:LEA14-like dessication related protein
VKFALAFASVFFLIGCQWYQDLEVRSVEGLSDAAWTLNGFEGEMRVNVYNPNRFAIQASDVDIALYAGEERIGSVSLRGAQKLQGRNETLVSLYVVSDPGALRKLVQNQLFQFISGGDVELRAVGEVTGRAFGLNVNIPVEATEQIQIQL